MRILCRRVDLQAWEAQRGEHTWNSLSSRAAQEYLSPAALVQWLRHRICHRSEHARATFTEPVTNLSTQNSYIDSSPVTILRHARAMYIDYHQNKLDTEQARK